MKRLNFRLSLLLSLLFGSCIVVFAAITFTDGDTEGLWYGPHEPNGRTNDTTKVNYAGWDTSYQCVSAVPAPTIGGMGAGATSGGGASGGA